MIVDTTVWIHYLRTPDTSVGQSLARLLDANEVLIAGPVLAELLQGAEDEAGATWLRTRLEKLPFIHLSKETWGMAGELSLRLRRQGLLTPLMDLLIATIALEGGHEVYTLDEHFQRVPGLRLHEPANS